MTAGPHLAAAARGGKRRGPASAEVGFAWAARLSWAESKERDG
jgi:hypothetical protein